MRAWVCAAVVGLVPLVADEVPVGPSGLPLINRIVSSGTLSIGGEYFHRRLSEKSPFLIVNRGARVLEPWEIEAEGNFGGPFVSYEFRNLCYAYAAVRGRWASGRIHGSAHEWNVEGRAGFTFGPCCTEPFGFTPYVGFGYEGGHMNVFGRQHYWWWYIPLGFIVSYTPDAGFWTELDAEIGLMADAHYIALDEPSVNNIQRMFGNRYRWEVELPVGYRWMTCWSEKGAFELSLIPFWHGWRTREQLQGDADVRADLSSSGLIREDGDTEQLETHLVLDYDQSVVSPSMLNNSYGLRLQIGAEF